MSGLNAFSEDEAAVSKFRVLFKLQSEKQLIVKNQDDDTLTIVDVEGSAYAGPLLGDQVVQGSVMTIPSKLLHRKQGGGLEPATPVFIMPMNKKKNCTIQVHQPQAGETQAPTLPTLALPQLSQKASRAGKALSANLTGFLLPANDGSSATKQRNDYWLCYERSKLRITFNAGRFFDKKNGCFCILNVECSRTEKGYLRVADCADTAVFAVDSHASPPTQQEADALPRVDMPEVTLVRSLQFDQEFPRGGGGALKTNIKFPAGQLIVLAVTPKRITIGSVVKDCQEWLVKLANARLTFNLLVWGDQKHLFLPVANFARRGGVQIDVEPLFLKSNKSNAYPWNLGSCQDSVVVNKRALDEQLAAANAAVDEEAKRGRDDDNTRDARQVAGDDDDDDDDDDTDILVVLSDKK